MRSLTGRFSECKVELEVYGSGKGDRRIQRQMAMVAYLAEVYSVFRGQRIW